MLLPTVAVVGAGPPDPEVPCQAVNRLAGYLGGMEAFVKPGQEALLLVNLRQLNVISYLCLVAGIAGLVQRAGGTVAIGDSPWLTTETVDSHWRATGLLQLAEHRGWRLLDFQREPLQGVAVRARVYHVPRVVLAAPVVINIAPVMRHRSCTLAGGIFNLLGVIPGYKPGQYPEQRDDGEMISEVAVDLLSFVQPSVTVLDASPISRHTHVASDCRRRLLASTDTVAVDCVAAVNLGLSPGAIPIICQASEAGLGIGWPEGIEQLGDDCYPLRPNNLARFSADPTLRLPSWVKRLTRPFTSFRPEVDARRCRPCNECAGVCPTGALHFEEPPGQLTFSTERCITCFHCLANCPSQAIAIRGSWFARRLSRLGAISAFP